MAVRISSALAPCSIKWSRAGFLHRENYVDVIASIIHKEPEPVAEIARKHRTIFRS